MIQESTIHKLNSKVNHHHLLPLNPSKERFSELLKKLEEINFCVRNTPVF